MHRRHRPHQPQGPIWAYAWPPVAPVETIAPRLAPVQPAPLRAIRPNAFNVVDPAALVSRTPSGRVVVRGPDWADAATHARQPYAPPSVHIIGAAPTRHMRGPVRMSHGIAAPHDLETKPQVIWLRQPAAGAPPVKGAE
ncbi:MAG: hypothetical protein ACRCTI_07580 [Beijerinckiaceae bacterium]